MLKMFLATTLLLGAATPVFATGTAAASARHTPVRSSQSVYRSERVIFVRNSDGTTSEQNIITVYYVFGYE